MCGREELNPNRYFDIMKVYCKYRKITTERVSNIAEIRGEYVTKGGDQK